MPHTYRVVARPSEDGWTLHVGDLGTTSSRTLAAAEVAARHLVRERAGHADVVIALVPKLPVNLGQQVQEAKESAAEAAEVASIASARSRGAAAALRGAGLSNLDIAHLLGVSGQRVSQLFGKSGKKSS